MTIRVTSELQIPADGITVGELRIFGEGLDDLDDDAVLTPWIVVDDNDEPVAISLTWDHEIV